MWSEDWGPGRTDIINLLSAAAGEQEFKPRLWTMVMKYVYLINAIVFDSNHNDYIYFVMIQIINIFKSTLRIKHVCSRLLRSVNQNVIFLVLIFSIIIIIVPNNVCKTVNRTAVDGEHFCPIEKKKIENAKKIVQNNNNIR